MFRPWLLEDGGNGHEYAVVLDQVSWTTAKNRATALNGYLATITSRDENRLILDLIEDPIYWDEGETRLAGPWIGGFQDSSAREPAGDWQWVTGEPFSYTAWESNQPDDFGGVEDYLHIVDVNGSPRGRWNDQRVDGRILQSVAYVVEREPPQRHTGNTNLLASQLDLTIVPGTNELVTVRMSEEIECQADWTLRTPNINPSSRRRDIYQFDCNDLQTSFDLGGITVKAEFVSRPISASINTRSRNANGTHRFSYAFDMTLDSSVFETTTAILKLELELAETGLSVADVSIEDVTGGFEIQGMTLSALARWGQTEQLLPGDADGDGTVSFSDFLILSTNYGKQAATLSWRDGDFNNDQLVGFIDFLSLTRYFGTDTLVQAIPEPSGMLVLTIAIPFVHLTRIRRRSDGGD